MFYSDFVKYTHEGSDGIVGEACELALRSYLARRAVRVVKQQGKVDACVTYKVEGKRRSVTLEVKTACGRVDNTASAQFVAYWPEPDPEVEVELGFVVFTREEWRDFLNGYNGRGKFLRVDNKGYTHIQSFRGLYTGVRPKASKPIAEYIYSTIEDLPTAEEWIEELRG